MRLAGAYVKPATSLLSLPDELIERIFTEYHLGREQDCGRELRASHRLICKRITALVERLWLRTISRTSKYEHTTTLLVNLLVSAPSKCQFVRDLNICIRRDSESLVYAALANLPNLQSLSLRLVDRCDNELMGPTTSSATSTHGLQLVFEHCINLRRLQVTAQSLPIDSCRLPPTISDIVLVAAALDEATAANLQQAGVTTLELVFLNETDTEFAILPWNSLQKLTLNFCLDNGAVIEACVRCLGEQVHDFFRAGVLAQTIADHPHANRVLTDRKRRVYRRLISQSARTSLPTTKLFWTNSHALFRAAE